jgi:NADPH:quinone reductase-like Zn-dependent oxidoreductase
VSRAKGVDGLAALSCVTHAASFRIGGGDIAPVVRQIMPGGVDTALELVGTPTLRDTLRCTALHGMVCFTGMLSNDWTVKDFYPIGYIPNGVRLTAYGGEAADLPREVLQECLDDVAAGRATVPLYRAFSLDEIAEAHAIMEAEKATGKLAAPPHGD